MLGVLSNTSLMLNETLRLEALTQSPDIIKDALALFCVSHRAGFFDQSIIIRNGRAR